MKGRKAVGNRTHNHILCSYMRYGVWCSRSESVNLVSYQHSSHSELKLSAHLLDHSLQI